jgi:hypothetical protein
MVRQQFKRKKIFNYNFLKIQQLFLHNCHALPLKNNSKKPDNRSKQKESGNYNSLMAKSIVRFLKSHNKKAWH